MTLSAWYDPSDLTTLFTDTAGTTPVTAHGDVVARINDKSGNGLHMTQSTASFRPLYQESGGLKFLLFDGTNDHMDSASALSNFIAAAEFEYVIGGRYVSVGTDSATATLNDAVFSDNGAYLAAAFARSSNIIGAGNYDSGGFPPDKTENAYTVGNDFVHQARHESGNIISNVNGGSEATTASTNTFVLTNSVWLGRGYDFSLCSNLRFYGGFFSKTVLSASDRASALTWMNAKVGL